MKIFEVIGTLDTVAARTSIEAIQHYQDIEPDIIVEVKEVKDIHTRVLYDEDGLVHGTPQLVTFEEMMNAEMEGWDGEPFIFSMME